MSWVAIIIIVVIFLIFNRAQNNSADAIRDLIIRVDDLEDKIQNLEGSDDFNNCED
ncbi:MAG: hypothetical protein WC164_02795 [Patescibacteria group bacterium]